MFGAMISGFLAGASASVPNPLANKNTAKTDAKVAKVAVDAGKMQPHGAFLSGFHEPVHLELDIHGMEQIYKEAVDMQDGSSGASNDGPSANDQACNNT